MLLLGDSGWINEAQQGKPFVGASGYFLERQFKRLGVTREQFTIANSLWCKAKHLGWTDYPERFRDAQEALRFCPYLDQLVATKPPRAVLTLGNVALRRATGLSGVEPNHAYLLPSVWEGIPAIPTFHPSFVLRGNQKLTGAFLFAMAKALRIAREGAKQQTFDLLCDPPMVQLEAAFAQWDGNLLVADIETNYSGKVDEEEAVEDESYNILRISLSCAAGTGISVPWCAPYIDWAKQQFERAKVIVFWNQAFDVPRLRANGVTFTGEIQDAMWAWHFLQSDLPKSLGFVAPFYTDVAPWKHLSDLNPAFYSAMDAAVTMACYLGIKADLERESRWDIFLRHYVQALPLLERMGQAGICVDREQQERFKLRMEQELAAANISLQSLVSVRKYKIAKKQPKDMAGWEAFTEQAEVKVRQPKNPDCVECGGTGKRKVDGKGKVCACCYRMETQAVERWRKPLDFNPASNQQVTTLIKSLGIRAPKGKGSTGEVKETTEAKHLKRLAKQHPVFGAILEYRERAKLLNTYIWPIRPDGRIGTTYGLHPSTLRKSSRNVNLQNFPKRSDLAKAFRKMLVPERGSLLVESDAAAIEAVLTGWAAGSPALVRLAKSGIHGWMASAFKGKVIPIDSPDLAKLCKEAKREWPEDYDTFKRVVYLSFYMGSARRMHEEYPNEFPTVKAAQERQDFLFSTKPGQDIRKWQRSTLDRAHAERMLQNPWGYKHYFYDVYHYSSDVGDWVMGDDAKRAVAFVPQSTASAIQTEVLLNIVERHPWMVPYLRLIIHDAIVLEVPERDAERAARVLTQEMTHPWPELQGLAIGAETKIGKNLADMKEISL